jgi:hypothetical protein
MAVLTVATTPSGLGVIRIFTFASVNDADTFAGPVTPKAFWAMTVGNPTTQASAGISVTESSGTYTFYPGENGQAVTLFVVV